MSNKSKLSTIEKSVIITSIVLIALVVILAVTDKSVSENYDAMSAQIEELSEVENTDGGLSIAESSSYKGVLEAVIVQATAYKVSHYIVVGGCNIKVSETDYITAKDNIGRIVTVETERKKAKSAYGEYSQTYSAVVTYEEVE